MAKSRNPLKDLSDLTEMSIVKNWNVVCVLQKSAGESIDDVNGKTSVGPCRGAINNKVLGLRVDVVY